MKRRKFIRNTGISVGGVITLPAITGFNISKNLNSSVNIGIIGTGSRGGGLIPFINEIENLNIVACCDILPFRLKDALDNAPNQTIGYEDYKDLLNSKDIDAVLIATPFSTHHTIALDAIESGKHVYCEKTLSRGISNNLNLVKKVKNSNIIFQTGHQYHSSRLYKHVVDIINSDEIGKITSFDCQWNRNGNWRRPVSDPSLERLINWRMYKEYSGGLVAELCSHHIDFVNWVLGENPKTIMGSGGIDYWNDGRETFDNVHLLFKYPSGINAKFTSLTSNALGDYQIKIHGDKGSILLDYAKAWIYPEKKSETTYENVDGVSGATSKPWVQGNGSSIEYEHTDPSKQALIDFRDNILNNTMPFSNVLTGSSTAIAVDLSLQALHNEKITYWKDSYNS